MHIKRFRGATLPEALKAVKESFGEDAVIISTKKAKGVSEVLAAIDFDVEEIESSLNGTEVFKKSLSDLKAELNELKYIFSKVVGDRARQEIAGFGAGAFKLYENLLENGIHEKLSHRLIKMAAHATSDTTDELKQRCLSIIMNKTGFRNPLAGKGGPKVLALVGPSGAGKSSTIAKIAVGLKKKHNAKVGLVDLTPRSSASGTLLNEISRTLKIPLQGAKNKDGLNRLLWNGRGLDVILIDTPGIRARDKAGINVLGKTLEGGVPIETALVMSLTGSEENQSDLCKGFGKLPIGSLIFTRIDETKRYGAILNTSLKIKKPVSYLCNGQNIPGDIKIASRRILGNLVLK